jgi:magnesium-transporting ATPase (P-type)
VNFSVLCIEFFGAAIMGEVPLSAVQLLWINLIMDTFAALALASEKPQPSIIRTPPIKEKDLIMTKQVWRQIYGVALWNVIVCAMLILFGKYFWGLDFAKNDPFYYTSAGTNSAGVAYAKGDGTDKCKMYTIIFETFVFLQIFNELNCRCIQPKKLNMFSNFFSNWLFLLVIVATSVLTLFFVQYTGIMFRVTALTGTETSACVVYASTVLLVATLLKLTPDKFAEKLPVPLDENKALDPNDPVMAAYNK